MTRTNLVNRRRLLALAGTASVAAVTSLWLRGGPASPTLHSPWGPLLPTVDEATGLDLLRLPEGFRYRSFGWTGDPMSDGRVTPSHHDGMGVVRVENDIATLVRNHELDYGSPLGPGPWNSSMAGGTTTVRFDLNQGDWLDSHASLAGTARNCAGGATPWGTWLSCEEFIAENENDYHGHGWVFEVEPGGTATPTPLTAMGRFIHEAAAVDGDTGVIYMTEDRALAGLYRFIPDQPGKLAVGGRLEMLGVQGRPGQQLIEHISVGDPLPVSWHPIEDPTRAHDLPGDTGGVHAQGLRAGGSSFRRLEGCTIEAGKLLFTSTTGGAAGLGQVWELDLVNDRLRLIAESTDPAVMEMPDNLAIAPGGDLLICEDGKQPVSRLLGLTPDGVLYPFAQNNTHLLGERSFFGDYRASEWAGACATGNWLFVNAQKPGITYAITGPWRSQGPLIP